MKILVILGLTSTGKTDLALDLAKKFSGELVSCDSRQVYKGLDIGTGKLPGKKAKVKKGKGFWKMDGVKVWMYDV
ncbi:MAG: isopentenyl transferase family protein, partial [Candidatus Daviesbacteria bacterium]|nr:isopentenyl transferase family protein [Candidatus Daviesbacteria bacterium]